MKEQQQWVISSSFEAQCRIVGPIYGCVGIISLLQSQIQTKKNENLLAKTNLVRTTLPNSYFH
ncbi:unnamed protein product [Arabidopsis lyrata]|uniref:LOB domain-containing protein n=1 Tax=Arabidopsis lyrata subsp. lyrata TaxID=81972 RepID=D7MBX8_ARALL|nr:hypothetical protein ARALYDRAFT_914964 [Arabidopsis lyrata subsp. lyrata]CAH8276282.1 unnamed protein product [Arabidopsis lyrata]